MNLLAALAAQLLHIALIAAAAPLVVGCIATLEARLSGHVGPPLLQPWRDLLRLIGRLPVMAENASPLFRAVPLVNFAAIAAAACLVPSFTCGMLTAPLADLLMVIGLLALARLALVLGALDIGSALGGMGASRTLALGVFAEPALLLAILVLGLLTGSSNLDAIAAAPHPIVGTAATASLLALAAVALVVAVGTPRAAASEAAMRRQAMLLEYSGRDLAVLQAADALHRLLWLNLIGAAFLPFGIAAPDATPVAWLLGLLAWLVRTGLLAVGFAVVEVAWSRRNVARAPLLLGVAALFGVLAAALLFLGSGVV
jgi:formate hydrogenlyase subunit 4